MPRGKPPVGLGVQYFDVPDKSGQPLAATVIRTFENGSCDLTVFTPTGGLAHRKAVFLFNDPELDRRKDTDWAKRTGVWDYVPGTKRLGEITDEELAKAAKEQEAKDKALREQKRLAANENKSAKRELANA
jgi:hypothetical protein